MQTERPLILISNDDGYHSPGIHALVDMVSDLDLPNQVNLFSHFRMFSLSFPA